MSHIDDDAELEDARQARPHDQYDGYRQLAAAVLELAIADEQASSSPHHAQRDVSTFLSGFRGNRELWCAWLGMDPAVLTDMLRNRAARRRRAS